MIHSGNSGKFCKRTFAVWSSAASIRRSVGPCSDQLLVVTEELDPLKPPSMITHQPGHVPARSGVLDIAALRLFADRFVLKTHCPSPPLRVTHHPSCSSTMNTKSCVILLQMSRMGFRLCASKAPRCGAGALSLTTGTSACLPNISPHSSVPCSHSYSSSVKVRSYLQYMKRKIISPPSPPYSHVCQVGDPVLRSHAAAVDPAAITGPDIQQVVNTMVKVMRKLECVGLSAPQIGVPLRILALEYPEKMLMDSSPASREAHGLSAQPLRIFVNPQLRVLDGRTVHLQEACESISGFSATVSRYLSVEVSGLNEKGEAVTWQASGWPARILQHEMDHLDGVLYIDRMDSKTFINISWQEHNE